MPMGVKGEEGFCLRGTWVTRNRNTQRLFFLVFLRCVMSAYVDVYT